MSGTPPTCGIRVASAFTLGLGKPPRCFREPLAAMREMQGVRHGMTPRKTIPGGFLLGDCVHAQHSEDHSLPTAPASWSSDPIDFAGRLAMAPPRRRYRKAMEEGSENGRPFRFPADCFPRVSFPVKSFRPNPALDSTRPPSPKSDLDKASSRPRLSLEKLTKP